MHGAQSIEKGESGISSDDDGRLHHEQNGNGFVDAERVGSESVQFTQSGWHAIRRHLRRNKEIPVLVVLVCWWW